MNETDARAKSINPEDACYWHAEGTTWIGHRDDTGFAVALDDYVAAHLLTTEEIEAIPSATELLEEIRARTSISPMSPKDRLLVAHRDEYFAMFWKYAEEDEEDAPPAMQALIGGQGPVPATQEEADEVLAWCRDGSGVCQFRSVLPSRSMSSGPSRLCAALPRGVTPETARHASPGRTELETTVRMVTPLS